MIRKTRAALEALVGQAAYIGAERPRQAERFLDAVEATLESLHAMPLKGRVHESENTRLWNLRVFQVKGFKNHLVFYRVDEGGITFVHLLHSARDIPAVLEFES